MRVKENVVHVSYKHRYMMAKASALQATLLSIRLMQKPPDSAAYILYIQ